MWISDSQVNTIAFPLESLPQAAYIQSLIDDMGATERAARSEAVEEAWEAAIEAAPSLGPGMVNQQVPESSILAVDWSAAIERGSLDSIYAQDPIWQLDLLQVLLDLLES